MFGLLFIIGIGVFALFYRQSVSSVKSDVYTKFGTKLDRLWEIAQESFKTEKYLRAEKALLTILQLDKKNATAYNRLGILYAKQQALDDAIDCFEIAQSLEPNASSLHNVGLIYYETERYEKAVLAFEQAIELESDLAARHIAYAKALEKIGKDKKSIEELERAVEIERSAQALIILSDAYEKRDRVQEAEEIRNEVREMLKEKSGKKVTGVKKPNRSAKESRKIQM